MTVCLAALSNDPSHRRACCIATAWHCEQLDAAGKQKERTEAQMQPRGYARPDLPLDFFRHLRFEPVSWRIMRINQSRRTFIILQFTSGLALKGYAEGAGYVAKWPFRGAS